MGLSPIELDARIAKLENIIKSANNSEPTTAHFKGETWFDEIAGVMKWWDGTKFISSGSSAGIISAQISSGTFSVPDNTQTKCTGMSTKIGDTSFTGTADQITIQTTGVYQVLASTRWTANVGGVRNTHIAVNGSVNFSIFGTLNSINSSTNYGFKILNLNAGDILTLELFQNSGSSLNTDYNNLAIIKLS